MWDDYGTRTDRPKPRFFRDLEPSEQVAINRRIEAAREDQLREYARLHHDALQRSIGAYGVVTLLTLALLAIYLTSNPVEPSSAVIATILLLLISASARLYLHSTWRPPPNKDAALKGAFPKWEALLGSAAYSLFLILTFRGRHVRASYRRARRASEATSRLSFLAIFWHALRTGRDE